MALKGDLDWNGIALTGAILRIDRNGISGGKGGWSAWASLYLNEEKANPAPVTEYVNELDVEASTIKEGEEKIPEPVYRQVPVVRQPEPEELPQGSVLARAAYVEGEGPYPALYAALKVVAAEAWPGSTWEDC